MENLTIVVLGGFIVTLISIMTPIIKLNTTITKLNESVNALNGISENNKKILDMHEGHLNDHEIRITLLEKNRRK